MIQPGQRVYAIGDVHGRRDLFEDLVPAIDADDAAAALAETTLVMLGDLVDRGSDSDGAWTEGSQSTDATLSSLPAGKYTLRVEGTWQNWQQPIAVGVKVEQNVNRGVNFCCALVALGIVPLFGLIRKWSFESARWKDSMFGSGTSTDSEDEE